MPLYGLLLVFLESRMDALGAQACRVGLGCSGTEWASAKSATASLQAGAVSYLYYADRL